MSRKEHASSKKTFRWFFIRGLGIVLPTILTLWLIVFAYNLINQHFARHVNNGVRWVILNTSHWPQPIEKDFEYLAEQLAGGGQIDDYDLTLAWRERREELDPLKGELGPEAFEKRVRAEQLRFVKQNMVMEARAHRLEARWDSVAVGGWAVLDLIGLVVAIVVIYLVGRLFGGIIGRRVYQRAEGFLTRFPIFKQVYPYVKQVTDFFVGDEREKMKFNQVVAVEYPRKGLWSVGLQTGETMRVIEGTAGVRCITVFIPSSPTPFTGYVITVPKADTIDLPISIDDAIRFTVSGGVIVPKSQVITSHEHLALEGSGPDGHGPGEDKPAPVSSTS